MSAKKKKQTNMEFIHCYLYEWYSKPNSLWAQSVHQPHAKLEGDSEKCGANCSLRDSTTKTCLQNFSLLPAQLIYMCLSQPTLTNIAANSKCKQQPENVKLLHKHPNTIILRWSHQFTQNWMWKKQNVVADWFAPILVYSHRHFSANVMCE